MVDDREDAPARPSERELWSWDRDPEPRPRRKRDYDDDDWPQTGVADPRDTDEYWEKLLQRPRQPPQLPPIYVGHTGDAAAAAEVAMCLTAAGFAPIAGLEQAGHAGEQWQRRHRHERERERRNGPDCPYAVVVVTPASALLNSPDLLWLLFCLEADRVCLLLKGDVDWRLDLKGVFNTPMDEVGDWREKVKAFLTEIDIFARKQDHRR